MRLGLLLLPTTRTRQLQRQQTLEDARHLMGMDAVHPHRARSKARRALSRGGALALVLVCLLTTFLVLVLALVLPLQLLRRLLRLCRGRVRVRDVGAGLPVQHPLGMGGKLGALRTMIDFCPGHVRRYEFLIFVASTRNVCPNTSHKIL